MARRILSICYDGVLLGTRQRLLEQEGYVVVSALDIDEAKAHCRNGKFDLVLLGNSVPQVEVAELVGDLREVCDAPVLAVLTSGERRIPEADVLSASDSPKSPVAEILYSPARSA